MMENFEGFFGKGIEFWIGKVVRIDKQRSTASGMSWGFRYKVRIMGTYSNADNIKDEECHTAMVMLGVTDGSGGGGRGRSVRITQHDIVFGFFMAPDQNFPVITGVLGRSPKPARVGGKFGILSGFTNFLKTGLVERNETNQTDQCPTPKVKEKSTTGTGEGKEVPKAQLENIGQSTDESEVNARPKPEGNQEFDTSGLSDDDIKEIETEEKSFLNANNVNPSNSSTLAELRAKTAERNASEGNRVGDIVDLDDGEAGGLELF